MNIKFTILGCGTSFGIPRIDGYFGKCNRRNKKNYRMRCSALISTKNLNFLIDTSPDIKTQLLNLKVKNINRVFYTHSHADQTHGINELRAFYLKNKKKIPIHADKYTKNYLVKSFEYCFKSKYLYPAILEIKKLKKIHTFKDKKKIIIIRSIKVQHGSIKSNCYIVNNKCAYEWCTLFVWYKHLSLLPLYQLEPIIPTCDCISIMKRLKIELKKSSRCLHTLLI